MGVNDSFIVRYSTGTGTNFGKAKNVTSSIKKLAERFSQPTRTKERFKQYLSMTESEQVALKSVDGWIYRTQIDGQKRNRGSGRPSDMFTLDLDYATPEFLDLVDMGLIMPGFEWFIHSSRRHTEEKPRLRIFGFFKRPVTNDEYAPLSRIIAQMFDPEMVLTDKVSFRPAQMMFFPTTSRDGDFFFKRTQGDLFDPDEIFDHFNATVGDWKNVDNWPRVAGEKIRETADKAEDPTEKKGPVGDFCRAYDVISAIEAFDLPYEPAEDMGEKPRYTYTGGTTTSGVVIEDGGLFLYSHHGSDPCSDMLVNAFDLVRIHKFGNKDTTDDDEKPINQRPSFKEMLEFIQDDPNYKRQQAKSKYDQQAMFDDIMDDYFSDDDEEEDEDEEDLVGNPHASDDPDIDDLVGNPKGSNRSKSAQAASFERPPRKKRKPPEGWFPDLLELDKAGNIVESLPNAQTIIHNDVRLYGAIAYDDFLKRLVLKRDLLSGMELVPSAFCTDKVRGDIWQDFHDMTVRSILAAPNGKGKRGYGMSKLAERDLAVAIYTTGIRNRFHPIKDYLWDCADKGWDGKPRVERIFSEYLGCDDTPFHREAAKAVLVASVARVFEPGHKFDFAPVLQGEGGIRKSSFIEYLYGAEYFGELECSLSDTKQIAETIGGLWALEFPELTSFHKSDYNEAKRFLSSKKDTVRMAYDRRVSVFPRQATFWGTTNDGKYLKDPTGNRRWWILIIKNTLIDTDKLSAERDQIWAEAFHMYKEMRAEQPHGTLPLYLTSEEAIREATELQEGARTQTLYENFAEEIEYWLDEPITLARFLGEYGLGERIPDPEDPLDPENTWVIRTVFRNADAARGALGIDRQLLNEQTLQNVEKAVAHIKGWIPEHKITGKKNAVRRFGVQARWKIRDDATEEEREKGYRVVEPPERDDAEDLI